MSKQTDTTPCPRCGGPPASARKPTIRNPFLTKSKKLCCSLCGLDYDSGADPWLPDANWEPKSSKRPPP